MDGEPFSFRKILPIFLRGETIVLEARYNHRTESGLDIRQGQEGTLFELVDTDAPDYKTSWGFHVAVQWRSGYAEYSGSGYDDIGAMYECSDEDGSVEISTLDELFLLKRTIPKPPVEEPPPEAEECDIPDISDDEIPF